MPRVKRGTVRRAKRKKLLGLREGLLANKSKLYRAAKESVDTALKYAFVGRRRKKRDFRRLWVVRINAAAREHGLTYGQLISGLKTAGDHARSQEPAELADRAARPRSRRSPSRRKAPRRPRQREAARTLDVTSSEGSRSARRLIRLRALEPSRLLIRSLTLSLPRSGIPIDALRARVRAPSSPRRQSPRDAQAVRDRYLGRKGGARRRAA